MRTVIQPQLTLGEINITDIKISSKSRDDIPQILRGLQYIYTTENIREEVFQILREEVLPLQEKQGQMAYADPNNGRPGMTQWEILVLGVIKLGLNADFDRVCELANEHTTLRQMLGHSDWLDEKAYNLQTIRDNLSLFTPETLGKINQVVVKAGHQLVKKNDKILKGRCDSFVLKTDVHYPTDINLLWDALRKLIIICSDVAKAEDLAGWRLHRSYLRKTKQCFRKVQRLKHSSSKDEKKKQQKQEAIKEAHQAYIDLAQEHVTRAQLLLQVAVTPMAFGIQPWIDHALRQMDQIERRVIQGETIPHAEKVFSLFQPHTEWINKGKAGVPVELGLRVCIMEDQYGMILHHQVMEKTTDDKVAVPMVTETQKQFPALRSVSMDKGFHSPSNQETLKQHLDHVTLPKKGYRNQKDKEREQNSEFVRQRKQHSAVESAINALQVHGLDLCRDHGIDGLKRYTALAIVSRNIQRIGAIVKKQEEEKIKRKRGTYKKAA